MLISLNEIKKYVAIPEGISDQDLISSIGSRLVEIEEVIDWAPRYQGVYVAKVIKATPIEGTHQGCWQFGSLRAVLFRRPMVMRILS